MVIFDLGVSGANALGIAMTIAGGAWYAWIEYEEKESGSRHREGDVQNSGVLQ